ncbi:MAG: YvcK family protein [Rhizobiaceae bacterium]|nr:YvcK family protein [Rhizobiaceae bacterium]
MRDRAPRIVLFSGGTACRSTNIALSRHGATLTRIVPAWDSGGSSRVIRETFRMLPVGDIRQALMTMAHGEGKAGDVVKIFNARLSSALGQAEAAEEFRYFASGDHPLLQRMEPAQAGTILHYLDLFGSAIPADFDFGNGSIGNFILTGAYLAHDNDINAAILEFRRLLGINGHVWPSSIQPDVELSARLGSGHEVFGQHVVTSLDAEEVALGITDISLTARNTGEVVRANPLILGAIAHADAIVFGPGSFYSSILPHLLVQGVVQALAANRTARRIFVGNILECAETRGTNLAELVSVFTERFSRVAGENVPALTNILVNRELFPFAKTVGRFRYLREGRIEALGRETGAEMLLSEFEDAWSRGQHDGEEVASIILSLVKQHIG